MYDSDSVLFRSSGQGSAASSDMGYIHADTYIYIYGVLRAIRAISQDSPGYYYGMR